MSRILIMDDDVALASHLQYYLQEQGYWVDLAREGSRRWRAGVVRNYSMILLEVQSPYANGFELLRQIRGFSAVPVIVLTRLGAEAHRITGLDLGADEYVVKPCSAAEMAARIRALLRRTHLASPALNRSETFQAGRLVIWPGERRARWGNIALPLTDIDFKLLERLAHDIGRPVSKADLSLHALGKPLPPRNRSIDVHMTGIQRELGLRRNGHPYIQAVHFDGYQLFEE